MIHRQWSISRKPERVSEDSGESLKNRIAQFDTNANPLGEWPRCISMT